MPEPSAAAWEYFRCVRESDGPGLAAVFAADASIHIDGGVWTGREAIRTFYETNAMGRGTVTFPQTPIDDGNRCAVEIVVHHADGEVLRVVDLFTVDDEGCITDLRVYRGPLMDGDREMRKPDS